MTDAPAPITIRPFEAGDAADVKALFIRINRLLAPAAMRDAFEAYIRRSIADEIGDIPAYYLTNGAFWVARSDSMLAGMVGLEPVADTDAMEVRRMYVAPEMRRRGLARRLLAVAEDEARRRGVAAIELSTSELQEAALAFYRAAGYAIERIAIIENTSNKSVGGGIHRTYFRKRIT
ncbi:MAG: GNAT family N-acetyltransferase [Pseudomonadota bacterium]